MKPFTTRLLLVLLLSATFISCKKDKNDGPAYYVKLKINGNWVTWKTAAGELGPDLSDGTKTDFGITANDDNLQDIFDITIQVDGSSFTTGTYSSDNPSYLTYVSYAKQVTSSSSYYDIETGDGLPESKYTIHVTSITDNELRGSFAGNYLYDGFGEQSLQVTEGEFVVPRIR
jgi:hypothetical protein